MPALSRCLLSLLLAAVLNVPAMAARPPLMVDGDADGVSDDIDECPYTPPGIRVNAVGCPLKAEDGDADGVPDDRDDCPYTPPDAFVDAHGCAIDSDLDGVADGIDRCPSTPIGDRVDAIGCAAGERPSVAAKPAPAGAAVAAEKSTGRKAVSGSKTTTTAVVPPSRERKSSKPVIAAPRAPESTPIIVPSPPVASEPPSAEPAIAQIAAAPVEKSEPLFVPARFSIGRPPAGRLSDAQPLRTWTAARAEAVRLPAPAVVPVPVPEAALKSEDKPAPTPAPSAEKVPPRVAVAEGEASVTKPKPVLPPADAPLAELDRLPAAHSGNYELPPMEKPVKKQGPGANRSSFVFAPGQATLGEADRASVRGFAEVYVGKLAKSEMRQVQIDVYALASEPKAERVLSQRIVYVRKLLTEQGVPAARIRADSHLIAEGESGKPRVQMQIGE